MSMYTSLSGLRAAETHGIETVKGCVCIAGRLNAVNYTMHLTYPSGMGIWRGYVFDRVRVQRTKGGMKEGVWRRLRFRLEYLCSGEVVRGLKDVMNRGTYTSMLEGRETIRVRTVLERGWIIMCLVCARGRRYKGSRVSDRKMVSFVM